MNIIETSEAAETNPAQKETPKPETKTKTKTKMRTKTKSATTGTKPKPQIIRPRIKRRPDGLVQGSAGALLVDTVCRARGATNEELLAVVGWRQVMSFVVRSCAQAGVKLRKERKPGQPLRYYGTPRGAR
jgi:hypothetical protein